MGRPADIMAGFDMPSCDLNPDSFMPFLEIFGDAVREYITIMGWICLRISAGQDMRRIPDWASRASFDAALGLLVKHGYIGEINGMPVLLKHIPSIVRISSRAIRYRRGKPGKTVPFMADEDGSFPFMDGTADSGKAEKFSASSDSATSTEKRKKFPQSGGKRHGKPEKISAFAASGAVQGAEISSVSHDNPPGKADNTGKTENISSLPGAGKRKIFPEKAEGGTDGGCCSPPLVPFPQTPISYIPPFGRGKEDDGNARCAGDAGMPSADSRNAETHSDVNEDSRAAKAETAAESLSGGEEDAAGTPGTGKACPGNPSCRKQGTFKDKEPCGERMAMDESAVPSAGSVHEDEAHSCPSSTRPKQDDGDEDRGKGRAGMLQEPVSDESGQLALFPDLPPEAGPEPKPMGKAKRRELEAEAFDAHWLSAYSELCPNLCQEREITPKVRKSIRTALGRYSEEEIRRMLSTANGIGWCCRREIRDELEKTGRLTGRKIRWNGATLEWLFRKETLSRFFNGTYSTAPPAVSGDGPGEQRSGRFLTMDDIVKEYGPDTDAARYEEMTRKTRERQERMEARRRAMLQNGRTQEVNQW